MATANSGGSCAECGAPLAADQRYCLSCGARVGGRAAAVDRLVSRLRAQQEEPRPEPVLAPAPATTQGRSRLLPSPWVCALLVLAFVGFGALLGNAASPQGTLSAASRPLHLVLASPPAPAGEASSGETAGGETVGEPPAVEEEPTPSAEEEAAGEEEGTAKTSKGGKEKQKQGEGKAKSKAPAVAKKLPAIKHVFVVMLADEPYGAMLGPEAKAPYVTSKLLHEGESMERFYAVAHEGLADEIALLSGQGPTVATAAGCPQYEELAATSTSTDGQVLGEGCVYPAGTPTLLSQLEQAHDTWKGYVEGIGEGAATPPACSHPVLGAPDPSIAAGAGPYSTARNPFVYFASVTGSAECAHEDAGLSQLAVDLRSAATTPSFSYIAPSACDDGSPVPCTAGAASGPAAADGFLKKVVAEITASPAYKSSGLLVITTDQAPSSGEFADSSSCCGQPAFPNIPSTGSLRPRGGGAVGALLLSPYVKPGGTELGEYNDFSLLRTIEALFGLKPLGYAGLTGVEAFPAKMFLAERRH